MASAGHGADTNLYHCHLSEPEVGLGDAMELAGWGVGAGNLPSSLSRVGRFRWTLQQDMSYATSFIR